MNEKVFDVNSLRVASPCSVGWENMVGGERTRRCDTCSLNVYNISELTTAEVKRLVVNREGRLCIKMYRRTDGTVSTKDCPVGLRAYRKRIAGVASAAFAAVVGLFSLSYGQEKTTGAAEQLEIFVEKIRDDGKNIKVSGTVYDAAGAVVPGVPVKFTRIGNDKTLRTFKTTTDEIGEFSFKGFSKGVYDLESGGVLGFKQLAYKHLEISGSEKIKITLMAPQGEVVGLLVTDEPLIEMTPALTTDIVPRP